MFNNDLAELRLAIQVARFTVIFSLLWLAAIALRAMGREPLEDSE
jgi:hypothetical protein